SSTQLVDERMIRVDDDRLGVWKVPQRTVVLASGLEKDLSEWRLRSRHGVGSEPGSRSGLLIDFGLVDIERFLFRCNYIRNSAEQWLGHVDAWSVTEEVVQVQVVDLAVAPIIKGLTAEIENAVQVVPQLGDGSGFPDPLARRQEMVPQSIRADLHREP